MGIARRDFFKFLGGAAAGLPFTPVPWKLLDDTALWSQNWSWIPRLPRGEIRTRFTTCTVCPAACGVRARCVGGTPVSLAGVGGHPLSRGALCPVGLAAHHIPYLPRRLRHATRRGAPVPIDEATEAVRAAVLASRDNGYVAVLDTRPGRAVSKLYRRFAATLANGIYLAPPAAEAGTLRAIEALFERPFGPLGVDLENTRTILSFGAPVLDGWGTPGRVLQNRHRFKLVQVEAKPSHTSELADVWLPARAGTETTLALGLARVIASEGRETRRSRDFRDYLTFVEPYTPESVSRATGIAAETIIESARGLATAGPALVVGDDNPAIAGLNLLVDGAIVPRRGEPEESPRACPGDIRVLIAIGDRVPWSWIEKSLAPGAVVAGLSAWPDRRADYVIAAPACQESLDDVPAPFDAKVASFSLAPPLMEPPAGVIEPAEFLARLAPEIGTAGEYRKARVAAIHESGRGTVFSYQDAASTPVSGIESAEALWKLLGEGAVWLDDEVKPAAFPRFSLLGTTRRQASCTEMPYGWRDAGRPVSPLLSKLYQESGLKTNG